MLPLPQQSLAQTSRSPSLSHRPSFCLWSCSAALPPRVGTCSPPHPRTQHDAFWHGRGDAWHSRRRTSSSSSRARSSGRAEAGGGRPICRWRCYICLVPWSSCCWRLVIISLSVVCIKMLFVRLFLRCPHVTNRRTALFMLLNTMRQPQATSYRGSESAGIKAGMGTSQRL